MVGWGSLKPHSLPYTTAWGIKDVTGSQGLLSNGDNIVTTVCRIMYKYKAVFKVRYASRLRCEPGMLTAHSADQTSGIPSRPTRSGSIRHGEILPFDH